MRKSFMIYIIILFALALFLLFRNKRYYYFQGIPITMLDTTCILGKWQLFGSPHEDFLTFPRFTEQCSIVFENSYSFYVISTSGDSGMVVHNMDNFTCTQYVQSSSTIPQLSEQHYLIISFVWDFGRFYPIVLYPIGDHERLFDGYRLVGWRKSILPRN